VDKFIQELETTPVATVKEAAKFEADRIAARGQSVTTKGRFGGRRWWRQSSQAPQGQER